MMSKKQRKAEPKTRFTVSLPQEHHDLIVRMADRDGVSVAKILRDAVKMYLDRDHPLLKEF
jgi:metal-responsive CopG/Arc/MetJ family transcriptional regulator